MTEVLTRLFAEAVGVSVAAGRGAEAVVALQTKLATDRAPMVTASDTRADSTSRPGACWAQYSTTTEVTRNTEQPTPRHCRRRSR